jgi:hypothetical protein
MRSLNLSSLPVLSALQTPTRRSRDPARAGPCTGRASPRRRRCRPSSRVSRGGHLPVRSRIEPRKRNGVGELAARDDNAGPPARGASSYRRMERFDVEAALHKQPRDQRVRVPHVACAEFVAAPHGRRHARHDLQQPPRAVEVITEPLRTVDRFRHVGDHAAAPEPDLIAEESKSPQSSCSHRTFSNDTALGTVAPRGCLLNNEPCFRDAHFECGVVEVTAISPLEPCCNPLKDAPVPAHRVASGPERQPVQIDADTLGGSRHRRHRYGRR